MPSRRIRVAGRLTYSNKPARPSPGKRALKVLRKPISWFVALVGIAATAVVTSQAPQWFNQVGDSPKRLDEVRVEPEIRTVVAKVFLDDEGRTMATARGYEPDEELRRALRQQGAAANQDVLDRIGRAGGVRVGNLSLRITLEGRRNQQIRITGIVPEIIQRSEPLAGTLFDMPGQGGEASLRMLLNLDENRPVVREMAKDSDPLNLKYGSPYFDANTISLKDTEQQVVILRVRAERFFVTFRLRVEYQIGGETTGMTIDDGGKPFAITALHLGSGVGMLSYEHAFRLRGDFSLCELSNATQMPKEPTGESTC
jgi:hypothetical protein